MVRGQAPWPFSNWKNNPFFELVSVGYPANCIESDGDIRADSARELFNPCPLAPKNPEAGGRVEIKAALDPIAESDGLF